MTCSAKVVRLDKIYMVYRVSYEYVQVCVRYTSCFLKVFPGGVVEPLCHARVPSLSGVLTLPWVPMCVHIFRVFDHVKPPKNARIASKSPKKNIDGLTRCHGQQYFRYQYSLHSFTSARVFTVFWWSLKANWVKQDGEFKGILKRHTSCCSWWRYNFAS